MKYSPLFTTTALLSPIFPCIAQIIVSIGGGPGRTTIGIPTNLIPTNLPTTGLTVVINGSTRKPTTTTTAKTTSTSSTTSSKTTVVVTPTTSTKTTLITTTKVNPPPTTTTTTASPTVTTTNPWHNECPVPTSYVVNGFKSSVKTTSKDGSVSLSVTYGNGTFTCPSTSSQSDGLFTVACDPDNLVVVRTDGSSWLAVQEQFWCSAVPGSQNNDATLQTIANITLPSSILECSTAKSTKTCQQSTPDFVVHVGSYGTGGSIGFAPLGVDGSPLPNYPTISHTNPIVTVSVTETVTTTLTTVSTTKTTTTDVKTVTTTTTTTSPGVTPPPDASSADASGGEGSTLIISNAVPTVVINGRRIHLY